LVGRDLVSTVTVRVRGMGLAENKSINAIHEEFTGHVNSCDLDVSISSDEDCYMRLSLKVGECNRNADLR